MSKNKKVNQTSIETQKKLSSLKNMYFNRYLMVRYFLAVFVFSNFYWALYTQGQWIMALPCTMLLLAVKPCFDVIRSYGETNIDMKWSTIYFRTQLGVNIVAGILMWTGMFHDLFPFLSDIMTSRIIASTILLIGGIMAFSCIKRLDKIERNEDKQYQRIMQYEKALKLHL
ncbi:MULTISPECIES: hypothetical protein [Bacillota]|jgi:hypothetical protein|uniref:Uncharacterized protein n=2 Tax=Amedibacillus TaxID=2749846 RepID=A0A7G9GR11_9FIRM|nr:MULTISPECIES: hypothetical protein [Bacillota]QNM13243.1 hypothetical protein H9Q80_04640 [[Eubacterium] hominis]MCH4285449.1 hypothetical protein [Amedibacillus hominis]RGB52099.1 hypothetical protein DW271_14195 [Absiella sp. AM22-9]RGB58977.1 hypothetical protein DW120_13020 [Absiella sp. AM10-20]RGB65343.1 hypothetical protein DW113_12270 [Absiella sp. AM09-45]